MNVSDYSNLNDHDLLITLIAEVKALREDLRRSNDESVSKQADHETRIRSLEQNRWTIAGAATVLSSLASLLITHFLK